jgi:isopentenyl-diphosphate delta-isomerase
METLQRRAERGATARRKDEHLTLVGRDDVVHTAGTGLDALRLRHRALPERALEDVSLDATLLGAPLRAPLLLSAMTGGTARAGEVNRLLAHAAAEHGIGLALGSGRVLLEDPGLAGTFFDPARAPRPPLLVANVGAPQVRGPDGADDAERIVELLGADALYVHLNPLQEALQPEGETDFAGVAEGIAAVVARLAPRPVAVKEIGFGLDPEDLLLLRDAGVAAVDVAGAGGTNWARIEQLRAAGAAPAGDAFADWGTPTPVALVEARATVPELPAIASGGLRHGVDAAKCLALGASAAGFARPALLAATAGDAPGWIARVVRELRIAVWLAGEGDVAALERRHLR